MPPTIRFDTDAVHVCVPIILIFLFFDYPSSTPAAEKNQSGCWIILKRMMKLSLLPEYMAQWPLLKKKLLCYAWMKVAALSLTVNLLLQ